MPHHLQRKAPQVMDGCQTAVGFSHSHLLFMMLEKAIDRSVGGRGRESLLFEGLPDGRGATALAVLGQGVPQLDNGVCDASGYFGRQRLGSSGPLPRPGGIGCSVTCLPLVEPTFRAAHLLTDVFYFVPGKVASDGLPAALFVVLEHRGLLVAFVFYWAHGSLFSMLWHT
jgi:hypothetical protein